MMGSGITPGPSVLYAGHGPPPEIIGVNEDTRGSGAADARAAMCFIGKTPYKWWKFLGRAGELAVAIDGLRETPCF